MAIAFGATTSSSNTASSSLTFAGPTVTGSNTILFVGVYVYRFTSFGGVTYNGVSMTQIGSTMAVEANRFLALFYIVNPGSAQNVVISATGTDGTRGIRGVATYYTSVKQTGIPDATSTAGPTASSPSTASTTTTVNNCWVVAIAGSPSSTGISASTGVTSRANPGSGSSDSLNFGDSNSAVTPAGSYSTSFTNNGDTIGQITASFAPSAETTNGNFLMFM